MDYLEGALLGKLWSDTDFENRKHRGVALFLCAIFWLYAFYLIFLVNFTDETTIMSSFVLWFPLAALMLVASPFVCYYYYNVPLIVRWFFLAFQAAKFLTCYFFLYSLILPLVRFDKDKLITSALTYFNDNVGKLFDSTSGTQSMGGLFFNAVMVAVVVMVAIIVIFFLLAIIPIIYTKLIQLLQYTIDQAFIRFMRAVNSNQNRQQNVGSRTGRQNPNT